MIQKEFNNIVIKEIEHCKDILISKGAEYAPGAIQGTAADRLAHFRKAAVLMDSTPKAALMGMLSKICVWATENIQPSSGMRRLRTVSVIFLFSGR